MKILILGNICSGKTTLAKTIQKLFSIPLFEIDKIVHDDINNIKLEQKEQINLCNKIIKENKEWVIEGMVRNLLSIISPSATLIIYLDISKKTCKNRLFKRYLLNKLHIKKTNYLFDKALYNSLSQYIDEYNNKNLDIIRDKYAKKVVILKSNKDIKVLLNAITNGEIFKYQ